MATRLAGSAAMDRMNEPQGLSQRGCCAGNYELDGGLALFAGKMRNSV